MAGLMAEKREQNGRQIGKGFADDMGDVNVL